MRAGGKASIRDCDFPDSLALPCPVSAAHTHFAYRSNIQYAGKQLRES